MLLYYPLHASLSLLLLTFQPLFLITHMHIACACIAQHHVFKCVLCGLARPCHLHEHRFTSFVWLSYLESFSSLLYID